ncbi:MAG: MMPL family transporter [Candidatus Saccharimonadales bacterium]
MGNNPLASILQYIKNHTWLRISLPIIIIILWFIVAGIGGPTFGKLSSVSSNDQSSFLPASAQSTKVQALQSKFQDSTSIPAIIVIESEQKISPQDFQLYKPLIESVSGVKGVKQTTANQPVTVIGPIPSSDNLSVEFIVPIAETKNVSKVVADLRSTVNDTTPKGQTAYVAGPAGLSADLVKAFGGIDGILLLVALGVVFFILLLVYRSVALPFIVLLNAMFALCASILVVYFMAKENWIQLNGQSQGILSILVIGAATDYSLLLVARYREALAHIESKWIAIWRAMKVSFEPIAASAATVVLALLCLLFSDLNSNRSLGPVAATGIALSFLSTITFLPALLVVLGRGSFWPVRPRFMPEQHIENTKNNSDIGKLWRGVGKLISSKPRLTWMVSLVVLLVAGLGILQLRASGVPQTALILSKSQAVDGQAVIAKHFNAAIGTPMVVIADQNKVNLVVSKLQSFEGVSQVTVYTGGSERPGAAPGLPKIVDGKVLINVTLSATESDSAQAESVVTLSRAQLPAIDSSVLVGGATATSLDTNETARNDLYKIIPIVLVVILVILILLLRAIVAPLLLIVSVLISYVAAIGVSALVFNYIFGFAGADASVPLFGFIFLVALGVDYNIFLMTRVREESQIIGTRRGVIRGLGKTGSVITSAGVVLAATFAALGIIPILFLAQIAFIVAFGVLLDTIIVRSLLVPSVAYDLGKIIWWPSKLSRTDKK